MEIIECNKGEYILVQVQKEDSLTTIMKRYNVASSAIVRNNPNVDFYEGEMIKIIKRCDTFHIVKPMETLDTIAKKYNTTIDNLIQQNNLTSTRVFIGQTLKVKNN